MSLAARYVKGGKILDIGCDRGYSLPYLGDGISSYVGIDSCDEAVAAAESKYPDYRFMAMMVDEAAIDNIPPGYDTILLVAVLEHMEDTISFLRKLKTLLNPGGRVVITSPSGKSHSLLVFLAGIGLARNDKHEHEGHYLNHDDIMQLVESDDYNLIKYKTFQFGMNQLWVLEA